MQNCIGKLLEKSVASKVAQDLEENECLPPTLGSYPRSKEIWMNAAVLALDVYDGFERGEEVPHLTLRMRTTGSCMMCC